MIVFKVKDMTCGHCSAAITRAVMSVDPRASLHIDLSAQRVEIEPDQADAVRLGQAITDAGYTPDLELPAA